MCARDRVTVVRSQRPPTVEIDTSTGAAYVRFAAETTKVVRTEQFGRVGYPMVRIDYNHKGEAIGVGLHGVVEFSVGRLLELAQIDAPNADLTQARYVGATRGTQAAAVLG